jgi:preprotein translocase subunit SecB
MSDEETTAGSGNGAAAATPQQAVPAMPRLHIIGQFVRDLSFENIAVQKALRAGAKPDIAVQVGADAGKRSDSDQFEVITKFSITAKLPAGAEAAGETVFLMELEYGGLFTVENVPEEQLRPFLLIEAPRMMFPFVRRIVADVTRDGGFPPLLLDSIDFVQLYRQQLAARAKQQAEASADAGGGPAGSA